MDVCDILTKATVVAHLVYAKAELLSQSCPDVTKNHFITSAKEFMFSSTLICQDSSAG